MRNVRVLAIAAATGGVALLALLLSTGGLVPTAYAHGTPDQTQTNAGLCNYLSAFDGNGQSFTPTASTIVAVDVHAYVAGGNDDPNAKFSVVLREGGTSPKNGVALGAAYVTGMSGTFGTLIHLDFPAPIPITPSGTYFLEFNSSANALACGDGNNSYAGGQAFDAGAIQIQDFAFTTYSEAATPSPSPTPSPTTHVTARPTRTPVH